MPPLAILLIVIGIVLAVLSILSPLGIILILIGLVLLIVPFIQGRST